MGLRLKTLPQIDAALRRRVLFHMKRGRRYSPKVPPLLHPKHIERRYIRDLTKSFTIMFQLVRDRLISDLPNLVEKSAQDLAPQRFDSADDDLRLILNGILVEFGRELSQNEIKTLATNRGIEVSEFNRKQNNKVFKRVLDVDIFRDETWLNQALDTFATENSELITTLSQRHVDDVRKVVIEGFRQGTPARALALEIQNRINKKTRANYTLIARDQVSKLNGQLSRLRQQDVGIKKYTWRTALDERVRSSHRAHEGETFEWTDPPQDTGHPGNDFQCRCYAEPVLEELLDAPIRDDPT